MYVPERLRVSSVTTRKFMINYYTRLEGHGSVSPVTIMTIRYNYCTRGITYRFWNDYMIE